METVSARSGIMEQWIDPLLATITFCCYLLLLLQHGSMIKSTMFLTRLLLLSDGLDAGFIFTLGSSYTYQIGTYARVS